VTARNHKVPAATSRGDRDVVVGGRSMGFGVVNSVETGDRR
jgi:hypothetical protein